MAIGCGPKLAKCILILFNLVFWLSGLIMIVIASMLLSSVTMKYVESIGNFSASRSLLIGIIIVGIIIFVIAFCGCCGAIRESKMLLGIYILFLVLIIFVQIAIGIVVIVYKNSVEGRITDGLKEKIRNNYEINTDTAVLIDSLQKNFLCCGGDSKDDWKESKYSNQTKQRYPSSCCKTSNVTCWNDENIKDVYEDGCREKLKEIYSKYSSIIIGVLLGIAFFEMFVVICAFCLCRNTGTLSETV